MSKRTPPPLPPVLDPANPGFSATSAIIEIHPINPTSQLAFDGLLTAINDSKISSDHANSMVVTGKMSSQDFNASSSSDYSDYEPPIRKRPAQISIGYFKVKVSFDIKPLSDAPTWKLGKATMKAEQPNPPSNASLPSGRAVDILLANPRSSLSAGLHGVHLYLRLHPASGVWIISVSDHCKPIQASLGPGASYDPVQCPHQPLYLNGRLFKHTEKVCLSHAISTLQLANLSYRLQFNVSSAHHEDPYMHHRDNFLDSLRFARPPSMICGIPFRNDRRNELAVWRNPAGSGAFGIVYFGFDPFSGGLRAIKSWSCKKEDQVDKVMQEISVSMELSESNSEGIIKTYGWHNGEGEEVQRPSPIEYHLVMESGIALSEHPWSAPSARSSKDWENRQILVRQLLIGLQSIHDRGWMHRDITSQNIIWIPPVAGLQTEALKLADFGKLCKQRTHQDERLAAERYRAPEIDGKSTYDQSIDIWGLGLAIAYAWFVPQTQEWGDQEVYTNIRNELAQSPIDLASLVHAMLAADPTKRPSASKCLNHPCLKNVRTPTIDPVKFTEYGKRAR